MCFLITRTWNKRRVPLVIPNKSRSLQVDNPAGTVVKENFAMDHCLCSAIVLHAFPKRTGRWQGNAARAFEPCRVPEEICD